MRSKVVGVFLDTDSFQPTIMSTRMILHSTAVEKIIKLYDLYSLNKSDLTMKLIFEFYVKSNQRQKFRICLPFTNFKYFREIIHTLMAAIRT